MRKNAGATCHLYLLIASLFVFGALRGQAATVEIDWTFLGFSPSTVTINVGDEVDIFNFDDTFDLQLTSGPSPENFISDIPPTDGIDLYYLPHIYNHPGTFNLSDEFGDSATVTVNIALPLSVTITDPTNNAVFAAPATFNVTATPVGGTSPFEMQFFVGANLVGDVFDPPFTNTITSLPAGNYTVTAVVTDANLVSASNSINISVVAAQTIQTNYILPVSCADIYSSGSVLFNSYLSAGTDPRGGLEFAEFNAGPYSSILLELNPYGLPLFGTNVSVYGFDGGTGTLVSTNFNSGTLIGVWTLPPGLKYGQIATFDVTAFVKSAKGPYFGFILVSDGSDLFSSTSINYGTPPELFAIGPPLPPQLAIAGTGNQLIISWPTNNAAGFTLQTSATLGPGASWTPIATPRLLGNQWVVTNSISGASGFFRLSDH
jgi:PKD repeat protein